MQRAVRWAAAALLLLCCRPAGAHFAMLLPESASAPRNKPVAVLHQWGHPFEHQLFNAGKPSSVVVVAPDGTRTDLTARLEKQTVRAAEGNTVTPYRFRYTPTLS